MTPLIAATDRVEAFPSWAAGTKALVYVTDRSGEWEIWLHQPPQLDRPLVTPRAFPTATLYLIAPTLSPDGSRVIYQRVEAPGDTSRLWMTAIDGGATERVTNEETVTEVAGSWSPDGAWYVYSTEAPEASVRTLKKVKTTGQAAPETLLEGLEPRNDPLPIWSPDGNRLLVSNRGRLLLLSVDDKTTRDLEVENVPCVFARTEPLLYCIRGRRPRRSASARRDRLQRQGRADHPFDRCGIYAGLASHPGSSAFADAQRRRRDVSH